MSAQAGSSERQSSCWTEMRSRVRTVRRDLSAFSSRIPSNFMFRNMTVDGSHVRLYFLASGVSGQSRDTSIYYVDLINDETAISSCSNSDAKTTATATATVTVTVPTTVPAMHFRSLFQGENISHVGYAGKLTREEELQLERKRYMSLGILSYEMDNRSGNLVIATAGTIFSCCDLRQDDDATTVDQSSSPFVTVPKEIKSGLENARLNPVMCPANPHLVAFVNNGNIWATHIHSGQEIKLTWSHLNMGTLAEDPISAGLPSYVMQEEFNRYTGFWWRPTSKGGRYAILYEEVDEREVDILRFPVMGTEECDELRFSKAGSPNAKSELKMVTFGLSELEHQTIVDDVETFHLKFPLRRYFPWVEYVVRMGWMPDGDSVWVEMLDRYQVMSDMAIIPITSFRSDANPYNPAYTPERQRQMKLTYHPDSHVSAVYEEMPDPRPPPVQVINRNRSGTWINVSDGLYFFKGRSRLSSSDERGDRDSDDDADMGDISSTSRGAVRSNSGDQQGDQIQFITTSEESGWRHLYLVTARINPYNLLYDDDPGSFNEKYLRPHIISRMALTQGQWCVGDKEVWVDERNGLVYFHGYRETPLEKHLYVVSVNQPCQVSRLTALGHSHHTVLNKECSLMVSVFSSIETPHSCQVIRILNSGTGMVEGISLSPLGWLHEAKPPDEKTYLFPELFSHTISSGDKLYGMMFRPYNYKEGRKYPVVLCVYGGPEVQLVNNTFKGMRHMRNHLLAREGYFAISIDSRGSTNRGVVFESHIKHRMGQVELQDQVEVLNWLGHFNEAMDMDRVAIHGWSYGGYLSLLGLVNYPNLFKVCISGAPVTCWKRYDTGYTERYMGLPPTNLMGYHQGSVVAKACDFPDEPDRLLIVHGMMDENVHFYHHTAPLLQALVKHGKPYQLQVYPSERHSLRRLDASEQYETTLLHFLKSNL